MELTIGQALQKAVEAHKAGQVQESDRLYTAILKVQPKHPDANHNMGVLAVGVGKVQEALPFFKTALEANPNTAQFWLSYIDTLIKLDRLSHAKAVLDQAKNIIGEDGGLDELEKRLEGVGPSKTKVATSQDPPQEQLQSLINLLGQGQFQKALDYTSVLLKQFSNSVTLHNIQGVANIGLGKLDRATENFKQAISLKPDYVDPYSNMGVALQEQGKLEEAIEAYNKAIAIKPDHANAYYNIGNAFKGQGKLEEAIEAYNKAIAIKPDYTEVYNNVGNTLQEQGKLEEAIEAYNKALSLKPDYPDAHNNMGNALSGQGKLEEAIGAYNMALAIKPDYAEAYNNIGSALKDQGKLKDCLEAYNKALTIKPDYAEAHLNLSAVMKYTLEDNHFIQIQTLNQDKGLNENARCKLSFALVKAYDDLGKYDEAFSYLTAGNALRKRLLNYTIDQDQILFSKIKKSQPKIMQHTLKTIRGSNGLEPR